MPLFGKSNVSSGKASGNRAPIHKARHKAQMAREPRRAPVVEILMRQLIEVDMAPWAVAWAVAQEAHLMLQLSTKHLRISSGNDDDIVARQLREAAMQEPDPDIREALWNEYRKYKGIEIPEE